MKFKFLFVSLGCLSFSASSLVHAGDVLGEGKPGNEAKPDIQPAKEDCVTKPKVKRELDLKTEEQKAQEQKALENLGLIGTPKPQENPVVAVPTATMETCK